MQKTQPSIDRLLEIMARLRDKETGCPWDIEQNFKTIAPHTLEETYEVLDAIERSDMNHLREELGDLLLQVVFHAQMAKEEQIFTFDDVVQGICDKLVNRHPHVFGDAKVNTAAEQTEAWEKIKDQEKTDAAKGSVNPLDGVPMALPALMRAMKLSKRAARAGFDWPNLEAVFEKLEEEVGELKHVLAHGQDKNEILEEIGDMIFCCVNIARRLDVDAEEALRFCNRKFETRFKHMRATLDAQQRNLDEASLQELNDLWDQAKIAEDVPAQQRKATK